MISPRRCCTQTVTFYEKNITAQEHVLTWLCDKVRGEFYNHINSFVALCVWNLSHTNNKPVSTSLCKKCVVDQLPSTCLR